jgi:hypothetical protein
MRYIGHRKKKISQKKISRTVYNKKQTNKQTNKQKQTNQQLKATKQTNKQEDPESRTFQIPSSLPLLQTVTILALGAV